MSKMTVHGGIRFAGGNPEVQNLEFEELVNDPEAPGVGRVWINTTEKKVKSVTHLDDGGAPVVVTLVDSDELQVFYNLINAKADSATTLDGYGITDAIHEDDPRFNNPQVKIVRQVPGEGQYSSVAAAVASIVDASLDKPYLIRVDAGKYIEPKIFMKPYIRVLGSGQENTYIEAADPNDDLVVGTTNAGIANVTLTGATGEDKALVYMDHPDGSTKIVFRVDEVRFGNADTLVRTKGGYVTVTSCTYGAMYVFKKGFIASDDGIRTSRIALRNTHSNGMSAPYPATLMKADGMKSQVLFAGSLTRASDSIITNSNEGIAVHLRNGGRFRSVGASIVGFNRGMWVENVGAAPMIECVGVNFGSNTMDMVIDHPGTSGSFLGNATRTKVTVNDAVTNLSLMYSDLAGDGLVNIGPMYLGKNHNTLADIEPIISRGMQTGLLEGGQLTKGSGLNVNVAAGKGYIKINNTLRNVTWGATSLPVAALSAQYVYVDQANVVKLAVNLPDVSQNVVLGRMLTDASQIIFLGSQGSLHIEEFNPNIDKLLRLALGPVYVSGSAVSAHPTIPRAVNVSAGHYFYSALERKPAARTAAPLKVAHIVNGTLQLEDWPAFDNTHYNSGNAEINATAGYYLKHTLYTNGDGEDVAFVVGHASAQYATLEAAREAPNPLPLIKPDGSPLIASVIVQQGNNTFMEITDLRPRMSAILGLGAAPAENHGDLLGLDQDHHTQYLRSDGTRKMTGNLDMDNRAINNVSTVNGVDVDTHAARHAPNGADPLPTAAAVGLSATTTNKVGVANSFARADHEHQITGFQPLATQLTNIAALTGTGVPQRAADGSWQLTTIANEVPVTAQQIEGRINVMSGTSQIPYDNTQPLSTEGTQIFSVAITPREQGTKMIVKFTGLVDTSGNGRAITVSVFRRIGTGAWTFIGYTTSWVQADEPQNVAFSFEDIHNTTQQLTYMGRIGISQSGGTWYLGRPSAYSMGGVNQSNYSIAEVR